MAASRISNRRNPKKSKYKKFTGDVPASRVAAAREFLPVSESQGFQFIYLPNRGREPISVMRNRLRALGIQNNRILDIHYPDRHVSAFLIHNDYAQTFLDIMRDHSITPLETFDPIDKSTLRDLKYAEATDEHLQEEVQRIHHERLMNIIKQIHRPMRQIAVARDFCFNKNWITNTEYSELFEAIKPTSRQYAKDDTDTNMDQNPAAQFYPITPSLAAGTAANTE